ncbi:MAG: hypothetical protein M8353_10095 [ANME-2 cluster archaeon]|nr:hypothetical protein [ANME-2 cluster archaeon]
MQLEIQLDNNNYLPGNKVSGNLILDVDKATNVRSLNLHVEGKEKTSITVSTGKSSVTYHEENTIIDIKQSFMSEGIVQPGRYSEDFSFLIPEQALPTYEGRNAMISYEVKAWIDIPKHIDIKSRKKFMVRSLHKGSGGPTEAASQVQTDISYTKRKLEPTISVKLPFDHYNAGETIRASVMHTNPTRRKIRKIGAELFSEEFARAKRNKRTQKLSVRKFSLPLENVYEGLFSVFQIKIPENYNPSFEGLFSHNDVYLKFYLDMRWVRDIFVEVPITVNRMEK